MPDHWQKQNKMKGEEKKERHDNACRSDCLYRDSYCELFDLCAHDGVYPTFAKDEDLIITKDFCDFRCIA